MWQNLFVLQIDHVSKRFYSFHALRDVSLHIRAGEVVGILGPNGAGKTTLFNILTGNLSPSRGTIQSLNGRWPRIGYKPERLFFPRRMRIRQYLLMMADLCNLTGRERTAAVDRVLGRVELRDEANQRLRSASKGVRRRVGLAQALLGDPQLLVLDEPTDGLDPHGQRVMYGVIEDARKNGRTVVMSSHRLEEITAVCTDIAIFSRGCLIYHNRMDQALTSRADAVIYTDRDATPLTGLLHTISPAIEVEGNTIALKEDATPLRRRLLSVILSAGYDVVKLERHRASLADIYDQVIDE